MSLFSEFSKLQLYTDNVLVTQADLEDLDGASHRVRTGLLSEAILSCWDGLVTMGTPLPPGFI